MNNCTCTFIKCNNQCNYYYSQPNNEFLLNNINLPINVRCLNYSPMFKNGTCRICYRKGINHRKCYIYSNLARKIQLCWFRYLIRKKYKNFMHKIYLYKYYWKGRKICHYPKNF